jgi:hypothetical protein
MAKFCECGSLIIDGSCTRKSCPKHNAKYDKPASQQIIGYIKSLRTQLDDNSYIDYDNMTMLQASRIVDKLREEKGEI